MTYSPSEAKLSFFVSGFTVGFSILTVWEAMKQTRRNRRPWTSLYIYMIWGEIAANVGLFVLGWVYFATDIDPSCAAPLAPCGAADSLTGRAQHPRAVFIPLLLVL